MATKPQNTPTNIRHREIRDLPAVDITMPTGRTWTFITYMGATRTTCLGAVAQIVALEHAGAVEGTKRFPNEYAAARKAALTALRGKAKPHRFYTTTPSND